MYLFSKTLFSQRRRSASLESWRFCCSSDRTCCRSNSYSRVKSGAREQSGLLEVPCVLAMLVMGERILEPLPGVYSRFSILQRYNPPRQRPTQQYFIDAQSPINLLHPHQYPRTAHLHPINKIRTSSESRRKSFGILGGSRTHSVNHRCEAICKYPIYFLFFDIVLNYQKSRRGGQSAFGKADQVIFVMPFPRRPRPSPIRSFYPMIALPQLDHKSTLHYTPINNFKQMPYQENRDHLRTASKYGKVPAGNDIENVEVRLLEHVLANTPQGDPQAVLQGINAFCAEHWMMHVGVEKGDILLDILRKSGAREVLELGGYCGYSALLMTANTDVTVHTIEINAAYAGIARQIHAHAGVGERVVIHVGDLQGQEEFVRGHGRFEFVFIDHEKHLYLPDLLDLERFGAVRQGTTVFADNIIYPGAPEYHQYMQTANQYDSTLYHSYHSFSERPDAVLSARRIAQ